MMPRMKIRGGASHGEKIKSAGLTHVPKSCSSPNFFCNTAFASGRNKTYFRVRPL